MPKHIHNWVLYSAILYNNAKFFNSQIHSYNRLILAPFTTDPIAQPRDNDDKDLLVWREATNTTAFESMTNVGI